MTEVIKSPKPNESQNNSVNSGQNETTWNDLTKLNHDQSSTTWEDLAKPEDKTEEVEEIEPIQFTGAQLRKLKQGEQSLYLTNPVLYTQFAQIKDQFDDNLRSTLFMDDLILWNQIKSSERSAETGAHSNEAITPKIKTRSLEQIADIYNTLDGLAADSGLFDKSSKKIDKISHRFNLAKAEMPFEEEPKPTREGLIANILQKLHLRQNNTDTKANREAASRNDNRKRFLQAVVETRYPHTLTDDVLKNLSKTIEGSIEQNQSYIVDAVRNVLLYDPNDDIEQYVALLQEIGPDHPQQANALKAYYDLFGLGQPEEDKFREEILPLISDDVTGEQRASILNHFCDTEWKLDLAIETLMPSITEENRETWRIRDRIYHKMMAHEGDQQTYEEVFRRTEDEIIPFELRHQTKTSAMSAYIADKMIDEQMRLVSEQDPRSLEKLQERIKYSDELLDIVDEGLTADNRFLQEQLVDLAFDRGYEPDFVDYLEGDLLPRVAKNDPSLGSWARGAGFLRGEDRIRYYELNCLTAKITPRDINSLLMQRRELPTSDANRLEQNRIDALAIEDVVIPNHSFIHYEHPLTNKLLSAMVDYYDTRGTDATTQTRQNLESIAKDCPLDLYGDLDEYVFDYEKYTKIIRGEIDDDARFSRTYDIPAIDVLRRLVENTQPNKLEIPDINDQTWRNLMEEAGIRPNPEENGKMRADWDSVGELVKYTNDWISERQGTYGLDATIIDAIAFIERAATFALRNVAEKERTELPYDQNFKEIVKLQELTGSYDKFNPEEFERFWNSFQNVKMDDEAELKDHYWRLAKRELTQAGKLEHFYRTQHVQDAGMKLQSGNLLAELISLTEPRQEETLRSRADRAIHA